MTFLIALYTLVRSLLVLLFAACLMKWLAVASLGTLVLIWKSSTR